MISLVLSVTSALIATLVQQWAREYLKHCARVRSLLFPGAKLYQISLLVEILPTLFTSLYTCFSVASR
ncbi:hypothetical protein BGY98DRAFT_991774 [Russula aff. rugulosa BPL654]|nr:hypothetical protein BGY98DRAFT_991774 [Russula aff. rugulosa BPL654]